MYELLKTKALLGAFLFIFYIVAIRFGPEVVFMVNEAFYFKFSVNSISFIRVLFSLSFHYKYAKFCEHNYMLCAKVYSVVSTVLCSKNSVEFIITKCLYFWIYICSFILYIEITLISSIFITLGSKKFYIIYCSWLNDSINFICLLDQIENLFDSNSVFQT